MMNVMEINGVKAVIAFDPEINMFRGEFVGLNGGADFYSTDIDGLRRFGQCVGKESERLDCGCYPSYR
jgi:predicted HicB family RNase H-like nuclease